MSFGSMFAGKQGDLVAALAQDPHPNFVHGGELAALTKKFLADVAALIDDPHQAMIVETSGHGYGNQLNVSVRMATVHHPMPEKTTEEPEAGYVSELPDAATHHPEPAAPSQGFAA